MITFISLSVDRAVRCQCVVKECRVRVAHCLAPPPLTSTQWLHIIVGRTVSSSGECR